MSLNFNLNIIPNIDKIFDDFGNNCDKEITNFCWWPNKDLIEKIVEYYNLKDKKKILDVGGALGVFPCATHIIDIKDDNENNIFKVDIDFDKFPFQNNEFEFTYCRHTIEDIQNPTHCLNEIFRTANEGYIETPSPLAEFTEDISGDINLKYKGYPHHRYFVWSSLKDNTIHILPKYPIIEKIVTNKEYKEKINYLLNSYPLYWNNYYLWNNFDKLPNIILYRHGVNMSVTDNYAELINKAIYESIEYTNNMITNILK